MTKGVYKNVKFRGYYEGKNLGSYIGISKDILQYSVINDYETRIEKVKELLNLDDIGSRDEFWQEVWDTGICKSGLNTSDSLWTETNVCEFLEKLGTYILAKVPKLEKDDIKITVYDDYKLFKRMLEEKEKIKPVCESDGDKLLVYKKKKNFKLEPKYECDLKGYKMNVDLSNLNMEKIGRYLITYTKEYKGTLYKKDVCVNVVNEKDFKNDKLNFFKFPMKSKVDLSKEAFIDVDDELFLPILIKTTDEELNLKEEQIRKSYIKAAKLITDESEIYKYNEIIAYYDLLSLFDSMTCSTSQIYALNCEKRRKEYIKYLNENKYKNTEFKMTESRIYSICKQNLPLLKDDMLQIKESKERPIVWKAPLRDSGNEIDWSYLDMFDPTHVRALLQLRREMDICEDALIDLDDIIEKINLDEELTKILELWRRDKTQEVIGKIIGISQQAVTKKIDKIVSKVINEYERQYEEKHYYMNLVKGKYKKCKECGKVKLIKRFDKNGKKGHMSKCKKCRKLS